MQELETIYIPAGWYTSKTIAAEFLGIKPPTLQNHIKNSRLDATLFFNLGYLIEREIFLEFTLNRRGLGRPTIYLKDSMK